MGYTATAKPARYSCVQHTGDNVKEFREEYGDNAVTVEEKNTYRVRLPGQNNVIDVPEGHVLIVSTDYVGRVVDSETFDKEYDLTSDESAATETSE